MLEMDGAMAYATVWLNGHFVGGWPYGYSSFQLDLTPFIKYGGENVLAVRLDNPPNSSRWYPGGGIYRNVWLTKTGPIHVAQWGTYITTPEVTKDAATINVRTTIHNQSRRGCDRESQKHYTRFQQGKPTRWRCQTGMLSIPAGKDASIEDKFAIQNPKLWDLKNPQLYTAVTAVEQDGKVRRYL